MDIKTGSILLFYVFLHNLVGIFLKVEFHLQILFGHYVVLHCFSVMELLTDGFFFFFFFAAMPYFDKKIVPTCY